MKEVFDTVDLYHGDCLRVLRILQENSVHSVVTDPPYHLTSIVQRFGKEGSAPAQYGSDGAFARASKGFMGKQWDGGDIAFKPETWQAIWRVLKPGGYLIAFSGTRTYHRMVCAIEDAGFDIRDTIGWVYGSGFPKSHDVSKGIDREAGVERKVVGIKRGVGGENLNRLSRPGAGDAIDGRSLGAYGQGAKQIGIDVPITEPATDAAQEWEGWGTALKPAMELIVLARKPLSEKTVAANVLKWGTGGLNIDGCRIATDQILTGGAGKLWSHYRDGTEDRATPRTNDGNGRWPANFIHDGSEEVLAVFPDSNSAKVRIEQNFGRADESQYRIKPVPGVIKDFGDSGSAARFFYQAKADASDRLGSKHPTVKPLDLMQYLVKLVTPKGGIVLDPFAGTGATGEAAYREGMRSVLIEMEKEYIKDIKFRIQCFNMTKKERKHTAEIRKIIETPKKEGNKLYKQRGPSTFNS
jgi:DNA modification methylase